MISDVLSDAVRAIDRYLADGWYERNPAQVARIIAVRNRMEILRAEMDTPPGGDANPCVPLLLTEDPALPGITSNEARIALE